MLQITLSGFEAQLHPCGALYLPESKTLLIADAHFGKAVTFRRLGVFVPHGTTAENLRQLDQMVVATGAAQIVFLGDFLHSAWAQEPGVQQALSVWRADNPGLQLTLVRGNHDDRAGDPPAALGIQVVDEPLLLVQNGARLALCHHPQRVPDAYVLAGHWHPCITVSGGARDRLRLPCFWLGDEHRYALGILPAFGSFTGMHPIERRFGDRVFAVAGNAVREVPAPLAA